MGRKRQKRARAWVASRQGAHAGRQRGRGAVGAATAAAVAPLLAALGKKGAKTLLKPLAKSVLEQAGNVASNYAMTRLIQGMSNRGYKRRGVPRSNGNEESWDETE